METLSRMMKLGIFVLLICLSTASAETRVSSKKSTEPKPIPLSRESGVQVGLLLGMDMATEGATSSSGMGFGLNLGVNISPTLTVGGTFFTAGLTPETATRSTNLYFFLGNLEYHFLKILEGLYADLKFGQVMRDTTFGAPTPGATRSFYFAGGFGAGYNYSVYNELSIGAELDYIAVFAPLVTHNVMGMLTVKYLFTF